MCRIRMHQPLSSLTAIPHNKGCSVTLKLWVVVASRLPVCARPQDHWPSWSCSSLPGRSHSAWYEPCFHVSMRTVCPRHVCMYCTTWERATCRHQPTLCSSLRDEKPYGAWSITQLCNQVPCMLLLTPSAYSYHLVNQVQQCMNRLINNYRPLNQCSVDSVDARCCCTHCTNDDGNSKIAGL